MFKGHSSLAPVVIVMIVGLLIAGAVLLKTSSSNKSDTTISSISISSTTPTPDLKITNASLISAATLDSNYTVLSFTVNGTSPSLQVMKLMVYLSNLSSSKQPLVQDRTLWQVYQITPAWTGDGGGTYTVDVPTPPVPPGAAGVLHFDKGVQYELWLYVFSIGPDPGYPWATQIIKAG